MGIDHIASSHADEVESLIAGLSPERAREVLLHLETLSASRPERLAAVRSILTRVADRSRTQHVRRVFTRTLEPFLAPDAQAARLSWRAPGLVHRPDAAALFDMLARDHRAVVDRMRKRLAEAEAVGALADVLASPEAGAMMQELTGLAVRSLDHALADPKRQAAALASWTSCRDAEIRRKRLQPAAGPVARDTLVFWRDLLALRDWAAELLVTARADRGAGRALAERTEALHAFSQVVLQTSRDTAVAAVAPLVLLHRGDLGPATAFAVLPLDPRVTGRVREALALHLNVLAAAWADRVVALAGPVGGGPLAAPKERLEALGTEAAAFSQALDAICRLDLLSDPRVGALCRDALAGMLSRIEAGPYRVLLDRVSAAALAPEPTGDHEAVATFLGTLHRWRASLSDQIFWGTGATRFRGDVLDVIRAGLRRVLSAEGGDGLSRFAQIARLEDLAVRVGASLADWLSPPSPAFIRAALSRLDDPAAPSPLEAGLISACAEAAREELDRIRHWKDPELSRFVAIAGQRLGGPSGPGGPKPGAGPTVLS
jgi:hypothetical protein